MKEAEDLLMDKKIIIKEALANGRLLSKEFQQYDAIRKKLDELANKYKTTQDAIAIRFCMDSYPGSITLSGANSDEHLTSNLKAKDFKLTMNELESFKEFALDSKVYWDERKRLNWN
jgi:aryl-alcohol dehydrogenase-like predicted oxidoreductase